MSAVLGVDSVSKTFSGLEVLCDVSVTVEPGERHAIIGPNGSGKTTLFNIISGVYRPSRGRVTFQGRDITGWPAHRISELGVARSFQIINVFPRMTVYENVRNAIVSRRHRQFEWTRLLSRDRAIERETAAVLTLLGLTPVQGTPASELSYGKQRHLELALTIARQPSLILLDEPTAGLNSEETRAAIALIRTLTEGRTLVMVEHDMDVVFTLADRITVLSYGRVLASGLPADIRANEQVQKAYLGSL